MLDTVLVTGGSGFLGNAVFEALQKKYPEWQLHSLDLRPGDCHSNVLFHSADIRSKERTIQVFAQVKPSIVVHTAGVVPGGQKRYSNAKVDRDWVFDINYGGTVNVLEAAKENGCRTFVYTSSCTVVSDDQEHDFHYMDESLPTGHATTAYGASKAAAEKAVLAANDRSMMTCALRPATIIGPGESFGVIATIHACIANGQTPYIIGDGYNLYDFVYISNVVHAHVLAVQNLIESGTAAGQAFFISNQEPIYFRDFMVAIWAEFGHVPPFQVRIPGNLAWLAGYIAEWTSWLSGFEAALSRGSVVDALGTRYSSNEKAVKILGYMPRVCFRDAVKLACADHLRILQEEQASTIDGNEK